MLLRNCLLLCIDREVSACLIALFRALPGTLERTDLRHSPVKKPKASPTEKNSFWWQVKPTRTYIGQIKTLLTMEALPDYADVVKGTYAISLIISGHDFWRALMNFSLLSRSEK
jgi:hypothetical protein